MDPYVVIPDNTVLVNLAHLRRLDLLDAVLSRARAAWTVTVARECARSARVPGLECLDDVGERFGPPLTPTATEYVDAHALQATMRKPGQTRPSEHMGECEAIAIICTRPELGSSVFLTDDADAADAARQSTTCSGKRIGVLTTHGLIAFAEVAGVVTRAEAHALMGALASAGRVSREPSREEYDRYVTVRIEKRRGSAR